mmetsp:Transcript_11866/g.27520  ORF Transcript_11866/g.27520 Transcript_11866/m.27520 type:complete len:699 (+) Transcript_11866:168-2264(+)
MADAFLLAANTSASANKELAARANAGEKRRVAEPERKDGRKAGWLKKRREEALKREAEMEAKRKALRSRKRVRRRQLLLTGKEEEPYGPRCRTPGWSKSHRHPEYHKDMYGDGVAKGLQKPIISKADVRREIEELKERERQKLRGPDVLRIETPGEVAAGVNDLMIVDKNDAYQKLARMDLGRAIELWGDTRKKNPYSTKPKTRTSVQRDIVEAVLGEDAEKQTWVYVLGGKDKDNVLNSCYQRDTDNSGVHNEWMEMTPMLTQRMAAAAAVVYEKPTKEDTVLNAQIFVVGGTGKDGHPLDTIEYYDRPTDMWNMVNARLKEKRRDCVAVALDQKVYILGGDKGGGDGILRSVEVLDVETGEITESRPMLAARSHACFGVIDRMIYVAGGRGQGYEALDTCERYDPVRDRWEYMARLPRAVEQAGSATVGDKLYVLGGFSPLFSDSIFEYDAPTNHWRRSFKGKLHGGPRHSFGCVGVPSQEKIFTVAGHCSANIDGKAAVWDLKTRKWEEADTMPYRRAGHACVAMEVHELAIVRAAQCSKYLDSGGEGMDSRTANLLPKIEKPPDAEENSRIHSLSYLRAATKSNARIPARVKTPKTPAIHRGLLGNAPPPPHPIASGSMELNKQLLRVDLWRPFDEDEARYDDEDPDYKEQNLNVNLPEEYKPKHTVTIAGDTIDVATGLPIKERAKIHLPLRG